MLQGSWRQHHVPCVRLSEAGPGNPEFEVCAARGRCCNMVAAVEHSRSHSSIDDTNIFMIYKYTVEMQNKMTPIS